MFCSSDSCDSAKYLSSEPRSRPLVMEAFYFLYRPFSSIHPSARKSNSANFVLIRQGEVGKMYLLGTSVNKGEKKARGLAASALPLR